MSLEFPPECAWLFAALTGEVPPNGDEDKLFALAEVHKDLHGKLSNDTKQQIAAALGYTRDTFDGDAAEMYQAAMKSFIGEEGLNYFDAVADQAQLLAQYTRKAATQLQYTKYMIIAQLVELLVEAIVAAALAFFFGASIQAYLAKCAIVRFLIRSWLGRMVLTLLMHQLINVGMGVAMDLLVQWSQLNQGTRDEYEGDLTKAAALSGAIQGLLAGPFQFLGNKLGKKLADLFGKNGGKNLGKQLDEAFPQPPVLGPKGPTGVGPKPPKSFGDDFAKIFKDNIPHTTGPGGKAAGDKFVREIGDTFARHLGGDKAGDVGRAWARTLLENTGKKELPRLLDDALKPLGDKALSKILGQGAADQLGRSAARALAQAGVQFTTKGVFDGGHAAVSEGFYNLFFSDDHTFKTSGLTFGSGMVEGRLGHVLEGAGDKLGDGLRNKALEAGLKLPGAGAGAGADGAGGSQTPNTVSGSGGTGAVPSGDSSGAGDTAGIGTPSEDKPDVPYASGVIVDENGDQILVIDENDPSRVNDPDYDEVTAEDDTDETVVGTVQPSAVQGGGSTTTTPAGGSTSTAVTTSANTPSTTSSPTQPTTQSSNQSTQSTQSTTNSAASPARPTSQPNTTSRSDAGVTPSGSGQTSGDSVSTPNVATESTNENAGHSTVTSQESTQTVEAPEPLEFLEILTPAEVTTEGGLAPDDNATHTVSSVGEDEGNTSEQQQQHQRPSQAPPSFQEGDQDLVQHLAGNTAQNDQALGSGDSLPLATFVPAPPPPPPLPPQSQQTQQLQQSPQLATAPRPVQSRPVENFGTLDSEGIGGVQLSPIDPDVATWLQERVLGGFEDLGPDARESVRAQLSAQALHDNRLMLLSRDGYRVTVDAQGVTRSVDVRLGLSDPHRSALYGAGRKPAHNNEQRQTAALDTTSQSGTATVRTLSVPFAHTFAQEAGKLTGIPFSATASGTHQQRSFTSTVTSVVNSTSLLRSTEPATPFDYRTAWSLKPVPSDGTPAGPDPQASPEPDWQSLGEQGTVTAWFPEHLAVPSDATPSGPNHLVSRRQADFDAHLNELPLWAMDSMKDPGALLRAARDAFAGPLGSLSPESRAAAERFLSGEYLLGALPLQRLRPDLPGGDKGTLSPQLLNSDGDAVGMFRVTAVVRPREGTGLRDVRVGEKYSFERYLDRQLKVDSLSKVSSSLGGELSAGVSLNDRPNQADKALRDFHANGSVAVKAGGSRQWDKAFATGATHNLVHNLRVNTGHVLTPAEVTYHVEFIAADGAVTRPAPVPAPSAGSVTTTSDPWTTPVWIRTLDPATLTPTPVAPATSAASAPGGPAALAPTPVLPPELAQLTSLGVSTAALGIHGQGVTRVLAEARTWLQREGFLPQGHQSLLGPGASLVKARLNNLRKLDLFGSQNGLLGAADELVDGGLLLHFDQPLPGGGVRRVQLRFTLDRDLTGPAPLTPEKSLTGVHMPSSSNLSAPHTSQLSTTTSVTAGLAGSLAGLVFGRARPSLAGDYKGTGQVTESSTAGASLSHTQFILTSNQQTALYRVPAVLSLSVSEGTDPTPVHTYHSGFLTPADGAQLSDPAADGTYIELAVPAQRTLTTAPAPHGPALFDADAPWPPAEQTVVLPDSSLVDVMRGSAALYRTVEQMLGVQEGDHATRTTEDVTPAPSTWSASLANAADALTTYARDAASTVHHTAFGGALDDQGLLLHESLHAQLAPAALLARSHQMIKGTYVIDDLFGTGALAGTDLVVEVRAVLSDPRVLGTVTQYGENDLALSDTTSHQVSTTFSHEGGLGLSATSGRTRAEAETPATQAPRPTGRGPVTGGGGVKAVAGRGQGRAVTSSTSTGMTRVPSESGAQFRIAADVTYEITLIRGTRSLATDSRGPSPTTTTRTVKVPGGIQYLATADQLRRTGGQVVTDLGADTRPVGGTLPRRFRRYGMLGLAAVVEATTLSAPMPATPAADTPAPAADRSVFRDRLMDLVGLHAPGSTTPGHRSYVPGLRRLIADVTSPAALAMLPGRGDRQPLSFTFPYQDGLTTKTVTVDVHGHPQGSAEELRNLSGRAVGDGGALENFTAHAPANRTESVSRTARSGLNVSGSVSLPTSDTTARKAGLGPAAGHATNRSSTVSTSRTAEDRLWQRTERGTEFTLGYEFTAQVTIDGTAHPLPAPVDGRVTLRFGGDTAQDPDREPTSTPVPDEVHLTDPVTRLPQLTGATPLRPIGNEVAYGLTNQQHLLEAVEALAPALHTLTPLSTRTTEGAAVRLTELLHGGRIAAGPLRTTAGLFGRMLGVKNLPSVTLSTQVFNPRILDSTRGVTTDRVRVAGFGTSSNSASSRTTSFSLAVTGTLGADGSHTLGASAPLVSYQSTPGGRGGGVSAAGRRWEKTGRAGTPAATEGEPTHEVEVDTVTTVTGPDGTVRYVTGTALMRVPERELLGLGVFREADRDNGVWDLSADPAPRPAPGSVTLTEALAATATDLRVIAAGPHPDGLPAQLWQDLGPRPEPVARMGVLYRAYRIAQEGGFPVELALRDSSGTRFWSFVPSSPHSSSTVAQPATAPVSSVTGEQAMFARLYDAERRADETSQALLLIEAADSLRTDGTRLSQQSSEQLHARLAELDARESELVRERDGLRTMLDKTAAARAGTPAPSPDRAAVLDRRAEMLRGALVSSAHDLDTLRAERARIEQWQDLTARRLAAEAEIRAVEGDLTYAAAALETAHQGSLTVSGDLLIPPVTDPRPESLASQTPAWTASNAPEASQGPNTTTAPRPPAERVAHPVLPHETRQFKGSATAAVHTERFDPHLTQTNGVKGTRGLLDGSLTLIRHHVRRERLPDGRTVRHFFVTLPFALTDGLTPGDLSSLQIRVQAALDTHINQPGYRLPESGDQLRVTAEFVHAPTHSEAVTLAHATRPARADQRSWDLGHSDAVLTHEILHYLGLPDEYADTGAARPHLFRRNAGASGVRTEGLMARTDTASPDALPAAYLRTIEQVSQNAVIPLHTAPGPLTQVSRLSPSDPNSPSLPVSSSPSDWQRPLSAYVQGYGTAGFPGVGMEHFEPLSTATLDALAEHVTTLLMPRQTADGTNTDAQRSAHLATVRAALSREFGPSTLAIRMPYLLSEHGHPLTVDLDGVRRTVDLRVRLSDPVTSPAFGTYTQEDPERRIEKRATGALEQASASGSVNPRTLPIPLTFNLPVSNSFVTGVLFSPTLNITHNQRAFTGTTGQTVTQTQVLRNNTPSHPVEFSSTWQARVPTTGTGTDTAVRIDDGEPALPLTDTAGWRDLSDSGRLTVQFPARVATVAPENTNQQASESSDTTVASLDDLPLWTVDSLQDPGFVERTATEVLAEPLGVLAEHSLQELRTFFGEANLRGSAHLQRATAANGQLSPILYRPDGTAVGMLRLTVRLAPNGTTVASVPDKFFMESHLSRSVKFDTGVKITSGVGLDAAVNPSLDLVHPFSATTPWTIGAGFGFKGGLKWSWSHGHNSGSTASVNHTLRTTGRHHLVPFTAHYSVSLVSRDGTEHPYELGDTPVHLRVLPESAVTLTEPGTRPVPPEINRLEAIGVSATPLRVDGTEQMFTRLETWLRGRGYLPSATPAADASAASPPAARGPLTQAAARVREWWHRLDEANVAARLANQRVFEQFRSSLGLRAALDDMADDAHRVWLTLPGGLTRTEQRIELSLSMTRTTSPVVHEGGLGSIETINSVALALPGTEQTSATGGSTGGWGVSLSGPHGTGPLTLAAGYQQASGHQTGTTTTLGNALGHDQLVLTRNVPSQVFTVPVHFTVRVHEGGEHSPVEPFSTAPVPDATVIDMEPTVPPGAGNTASPSLRVLVPGDRTMPLEGTRDQVATGTPREGRIRPVDDSDRRLLGFRTEDEPVTAAAEPVLRIPDDAFVDLVRGARRLREAILDALVAPGSTGENAGGDGTPTPFSSRNWPSSVLFGPTPQDHRASLTEQLNAAVNATQLTAHAHQLFKSSYVIEGLVLPGLIYDTEVSVEIQAFARGPRLVSEAEHAQYIETGVSSTRSFARQVTDSATFERSTTLSGKEQQASGTWASALHPALGHTSTSRDDHTLTTTTSDGVTRTPTEATRLLRIGADTTFVVTVRQGRRNFYLNAVSEVSQHLPGSAAPLTVTRAVDLPDGLQLLVTPGQAGRNREFFAAVSGVTPPAPPAVGDLPFPQPLRDGQAFGVGAVLNVVPLAPRESTTDTTDTTDTTEAAGRRPDPERDRFGRVLRELVERAAPGLLSPGDAYGPGVRARLADLTSTAGLRMLASRGANNPLRHHFVHVRNGIARLVEVSVHATPAENLRDVRGSRVDGTSSGQENTFTHVPGNTTVSDGSSAQNGVTFTPGTRHPRPPVGTHMDVFAPKVAHSSARTVATSSGTASDQRFWLRSDAAAEYTLEYEYHAEVRTRTLPFTPAQLTQELLHSDWLRDHAWAQWLSEWIGSASEYGPPLTPPAHDRLLARVDLRFTSDDVHSAGRTTLENQELTTREATVLGSRPLPSARREEGPEDPARRWLPNGVRPLVVHSFSGIGLLHQAVREVAPGLGLPGTTPDQRAEAGDQAAVRFTELAGQERLTVGGPWLAGLLGLDASSYGSSPSGAEVTLSVALHSPALLRDTGALAMDRVFIQTTSGATSTTRSDATAFTAQLGVKGPVPQMTLGPTAPLAQFQHQPPGAAATHTATDRNWQRQGVTSVPEGERTWRTHLVSFSTVITVTGANGDERRVEGSATVRLSERDLLGLGVLPGRVTEQVFDGTTLLRESAPSAPADTAPASAAPPASVAERLAAGITNAEPDALPAELWLDVRGDAALTLLAAYTGETGETEAVTDLNTLALALARHVAELAGRPVTLGLLTDTGRTLVDSGPLAPSARSALSDLALDILTGGGSSRTANEPEDTA